VSPPGPLQDYLSRIRELADRSDPSPLLAHSYVRYLGDLSGGQTVRHTIAKAYDLDEASGLGVSFYGFKELRSTKPASQGEMKRIKDWFREGMNAAGEKSPEAKRKCQSLNLRVKETVSGIVRFRDKYGLADYYSPSLASVVEEASTAFILNAGLFDSLELETEDSKEVKIIETNLSLAEQSFPFSQVVAVIAAGAYL